MIVAAFVLYLVGAVVLFGVRSWIQYRHTGSTGFRGVSGRAMSVEWFGGVLFVVAVVVGLLGVALPVFGALSAYAPTSVRVIGFAIAACGFLVILAAQTGMGTSWRIGVDAADRTALVTTGLFRRVRNPIFTAMTAAQIGMMLIVPSGVSALAVGLLIAAIQIQVRAVEEPYLLGVHGSAYRDYLSRTGRFLPQLRSLVVK
jgi:protein-S-isoprenylcysteine O-methyltransferase Ste14